MTVTLFESFIVDALLELFKILESDEDITIDRNEYYHLIKKGGKIFFKIHCLSFPENWKITLVRVDAKATTLCTLVNNFEEQFGKKHEFILQ